MNPYEILGVARDATADVIRRAFRKKASRAHPDRSKGDGTAMAEINGAYALLSDANRRERFDRTGSTDKPADPQQQAMGILFNIVKQLIANNVPNDLIGNARAQVGVLITQSLLTVQQHESQKAIFERRRGTIRARKDRNIFDGLFIELIQAAERNIANCKAQVEAFQAALTLLEDYESTDEMMQQIVTLDWGAGFAQGHAKG